MKKNELRIGNYYQLKEGILGGGICRITKLKDFILIGELIEEESIKAIPLTEEWLQKFGFVVIEDEGDVKHYCKYKYDITWNDGDDFYFGIRDLNGSIYSLMQIYIVDELQNLFAILTKEELI